MRLFKFCLILLALIFTVTAVFAKDVKKLKIAYSDWAPYTYYEDGTAKGMEIEILTAVLKSMGVRAEYTRYAWRRCLVNLKYGESDAAVSMLKTPEREEYTYYPNENINLSKMLFFSSKNDTIIYTGDFNTLKNYKIGILEGYSYGLEFDEANYLNKELVSNIRILIQQVISGKMDLGIDNQASIVYYSTRLGLENDIKLLNPPVAVKKLYVGFSKANSLDEFTQKFSKALNKFKQTQEYKDIIKKYDLP